jgi:tetratricopeptide (TPR) repeat protein
MLPLTQPLGAAPYTPRDDAEVLERLPLRAADARGRELARLREAHRRAPRDASQAEPLVRRYVELAGADGDPRWIGYAQAVLDPWWTSADAPPALRVLRAIVLQYSHRFELALADLAAVLREDADNVEAWAWQAAILMVQARYAEARAACDRVAALSTPLIGTACLAQVDGSIGRAAAAAAALDAALHAAPDAPADERLWSLTRLAELQERRGRFTEAEAAYRAGLVAAQALGRDDVYLLAAYADFLLDRGRPAEVKALLAERPRADTLLLRAALAHRALGDAPAAERERRELEARFAASRRRGDALHEKEEARFLLAFGNEPARALALAAENFAVQREPADARVLLEAALAAGQRAAAEPALRWLAESGIESRVLRDLAARVQALR